ncbi:hypothetical protein LEP1GSC096_0699 [Leptospira interrogans serovar Hebdomadis str. R499]|nr:hypothetical protein LEP1GSC080_2912 [Leptospira interrogans str. FPW2026]EKR38140.1 hypothetical protein LEP1GSC096_0699 [Leptospira interrogans serovar Hebdomadis str. R499]EMN70260.1 hypothetical protein LEP1GSC100_1661 [Leptospira interrogans serovar Bataviae str. UI 08561]EMO00054.1 hypothetical protein LEP1GSC112_2780 [Leptospira interrogans serovar Pomona str. UT364]
MNTTDSIVINFYFLNCGSSHIERIDLQSSSFFQKNESG